jgi:hypothetical protein
MIFIMDHGGTKGHTSLVEQVNNGLISIIKANTHIAKTHVGGV